MQKDVLDQALAAPALPDGALQPLPPPVHAVQARLREEGHADSTLGQNARL